MDEGKIGYRNINKGMRRISALEREGFATAALLKKVVDTLKLDAEEAISFVAGIAKEQHNKCWVILSRKEKVYIAEDDEIRERLRLTMVMRIILIDE